MKILLTKTLFISLFLSAGAPVAIQAYESNSGGFASKLVTAAADEMGYLKNNTTNCLQKAKFCIDNNAQRVWFCLKNGADNIDNFLTKNPEKAGIYAAGTAAGCYLAYKAYNSEKLKPIKEKAARLLDKVRDRIWDWDNIKYLSIAVLPREIGMTLGRVMVRVLDTSLEHKKYFKNMSKDSVLMLKRIAKVMEIAGTLFLAQYESYFLGEMPFLKGMNKNLLYVLSYCWIDGRMENSINSLERDLAKKV